MSDSWHMVSLQEPAIMAGKFPEIKNEFEALYMALGAPMGAGLYCDSQMSDIPLNFYFPPACIPLFEGFLKKWGAVQSGPPKVAKSPLVGRS